MLISTVVIALKTLGMMVLKISILLSIAVHIRLVMGSPAVDSAVADIEQSTTTTPELILSSTEDFLPIERYGRDNDGEDSMDSGIEGEPEPGCDNDDDDEESGGQDLLRKHKDKKPKLPPFDPKICQLPSTLKSEIKQYKNTVHQIVHTIITGSYKHKAFNDLATFVDQFGPRLAGTDVLERSLDYWKHKLVDLGLDVHTEPVQIPKWKIIHQSAELIEPWGWPYPVSILALHYSSGNTPPEGITAELVVMFSKKEVKMTPEKFKGKIVLCNGKCSIEDLQDAGALAVLRGNHGLGMHALHQSGIVHLKESYPKIPIALITADDTEMFARIYKRGKAKMVLQMKLIGTPRTMRTSKNVVGDFLGATKPKEIVSISGHVDSWSIGRGAQDDGFGVILAYESLSLIKQLNLIPKRTMRFMFWTTEEIGEWGSRTYVKKHAAELSNWQVQMEADSGCMGGKFLQLAFNGHPDFGCIVHEIYKMIYESLVSSASSYSSLSQSQDFVLPNDTIKHTSHWSSDSDQFIKYGVPTLGISTGVSDYHFIYHTNGDTMTMVKPDELDVCLSLFAASAYVLADINTKVPREEIVDYE